MEEKAIRSRMDLRHGGSVDGLQGWSASTINLANLLEASMLTEILHADGVFKLKSESRRLV